MFCMRSMVGFYEKLHKGRGEVWFQPLYFITASKIYGTRLSVFKSKFLSNYNLFVTEVITNTHYIPCRNPDKHSKKKNLFKDETTHQPTHKTISVKMLMTILQSLFFPCNTCLFKESTHQDNCMWSPGS